MPVIGRAELSGKLDDLVAADSSRVFLFFGERFLCKTAADQLQQAFLAKQQGCVCTIDGDREDSSQTLAKLMSYSLLPGLQIFRVNDTKLFHSKNISQSIWKRAWQAYEANRLEQAARYIGELYGLAGLAAEEREPLERLSKDQWQKLFGLEKPADLGWTNALTDLLASQGNHGANQGDPAEQYIQNLEKGLPANNIFILCAETIDKRKRLFTWIKKNGYIIDCSVAEGAGAAAQRAQKSVLQEVMQKTLAEFETTIAPGAVDVFFERVGFHPVAVATETAKLALYCHDQPQITLEDIKKMVGRSREDALFELTDAFGKGRLGKTLITLAHLLEDGVHALAIVATMRNYIRKLLIFKSLQHQASPAYQQNMNASYFQESYLPKLRENSTWQDQLKGHPYALFMSFSKAAEFRTTTLKEWLTDLLDAEYRLKGSGIADRLILEELFITMLRSTAEKKKEA